MMRGGQLTDRIRTAELELQPVDLIFVQRVVVQHPNVHIPFLEIRGRGDTDAWREMLVDLRVHHLDMSGLSTKPPLHV